LSNPRPGSEFETTHWSIVSSSRNEDTDIRNKSLTELYQSYWYPLFAYLRRKGHSTSDASDYVQGFFVELIDKEYLSAVAPEKGRFRWFLMSAIGRYVNKQTEKKCGGKQTFSLDVEQAEQRYQREPVDGWTAEKLFDRRWALEVLSQALSTLRERHVESGKADLYDALQPTLTGEPLTNQQCEEIGNGLNMTAVAVKVAAHRLKEKYRKVLVDIVSETIIDPGKANEVDNELDALLKALGG